MKGNFFLIHIMLAVAINFNDLLVSLIFIHFNANKNENLVKINLSLLFSITKCRNKHISLKISVQVEINAAICFILYGSISLVKHFNGEF